MSSLALQAFLVALDEVIDLGSASRPLVFPTSEALRLARAIGRGQIVLLSSHFERYFYAANEELISFLNDNQVTGDKLPERLRLLHSASPIDDLGTTGWEHRSNQLRAFVEADGWLWSNKLTGGLSHDRMLAWMKAPRPQSLVRYYSYWGINDIFSAITRNRIVRGELWLGVQGLVDLRNNIAHATTPLKQPSQMLDAIS